MTLWRVLLVVVLAALALMGASYGWVNAGRPETSPTQQGATT